MIIIIDYGMGNLGSIVNMFKKIGLKAIISADPDIIQQATHLILPGVGAFDTGMQNLADRGLIPLLNQRVLEEHVPVLGICLGMQLLSRRSEEGQLPGLGWIAADTLRFHPTPEEPALKIPHMGWNFIEQQQQHPLLADMFEDPRFYFVHSYYVSCEQPNDVLATAAYGIPFTAMIARDNILGAQFHPEKSHKYGMKLLKNFVECCV